MSTQAAVSTLSPVPSLALVAIGWHPATHLSVRVSRRLRASWSRVRSRSTSSTLCPASPDGDPPTPHDRLHPRELTFRGFECLALPQPHITPNDASPHAREPHLGWFLSMAKGCGSGSGRRTGPPRSRSVTCYVLNRGFRVLGRRQSRDRTVETEAAFALAIPACPTGRCCCNTSVAIVSETKRRGPSLGPRGPRAEHGQGAARDGGCRCCPLSPSSGAGTCREQAGGDLPDDEGSATRRTRWGRDRLPSIHHMV